MAYTRSHVVLQVWKPDESGAQSDFPPTAPKTPSLGLTVLSSQAKYECWDTVAPTHPEAAPVMWRPFQLFNCTLELE